MNTEKQTYVTFVFRADDTFEDIYMDYKVNNDHFTKTDGTYEHFTYGVRLQRETAWKFNIYRE